VRCLCPTLYKTTSSTPALDSACTSALRYRHGTLSNVNLNQSCLRNIAKTNTKVQPSASYRILLVVCGFEQLAQQLPSRSQRILKLASTTSRVIQSAEVPVSRKPLRLLLLLLHPNCYHLDHKCTHSFPATTDDEGEENEYAVPTRRPLQFQFLRKLELSSTLPNCISTKPILPIDVLVLFLRRGADPRASYRSLRAHNPTVS
jgi:hypothetical protein